MNKKISPEIKIANSKEEFEAAKMLFTEYSNKLGFDLCFQNFKEELQEIKIQYNKPHGGLILLKNNIGFIACVGIRMFNIRIAELKRMYVKEEFRGYGYGKLLLNEAIKLAKNLGYEKIWLDTLQNMEAAISLYKKNGFKNIESYRENPIAGAEYLELNI